MYAFLKGIFLGLSLVMPLGPLNIFIFNNSAIQQRFFAILPVILVASLCDLGLIYFAVTGVDVISTITWFKPLLMSVGIAFLFYMGTKMWREASPVIMETATPRGVSSQIFSSMTLSLLNPHAILDTFVVIGAVSATYVGFDKHLFTAGCMFSDFAWFFFLGLFGFFLRHIPNGPKIFFFINRFSAVVMIYLGLQLSVDLFRESIARL